MDDAVLALAADGKGDGGVVALPAADDGHFVLIGAGDLGDGGFDNSVEIRGSVDGPEPFNLVTENEDVDGVAVELNAAVGVEGGGGNGCR